MAPSTYIVPLKNDCNSNSKEYDTSSDLPSDDLRGRHSFKKRGKCGPERTLSS